MVFCINIFILGVFLQLQWTFVSKILSNTDTFFMTLSLCYIYFILGCFASLTMVPIIFLLCHQADTIVIDESPPTSSACKRVLIGGNKSSDDDDQFEMSPFAKPCDRSQSTRHLWRYLKSS